MRRSLQQVLLLALCLQLQQVAADSFSSGGLFSYLRDTILCTLHKCCAPPYVQPNFPRMGEELHRLVYGQHIVQETLVPAMKSHFNRQPSKPLVLSFHGATGSGKNYVARIIAEHMYEDGFESPFVHHIVATAEFPDKGKMNEYQVELQNRLITSVKTCGRSMFIFDEVDKLPEQLLDSIKPFLDYYNRVKGVDFRNAVFIFLSNAGGHAISQATLQQRASNQPRNKLRLADLERIVSAHVYNTAGGLKMSELISNHLIDHFVPFLPLEREHVRNCIKYYLQSRDATAAADPALVEEVLEGMQFYPKDDPAYSSSGCKRVDAKADVAIYGWRERRREKSEESEDLWERGRELLPGFRLLGEL